ncbi:MAG: hypothetical protein ACR2QK_07875, partial [Acidimicrobiales bacterium]
MRRLVALAVVPVMLLTAMTAVSAEPNGSADAQPAPASARVLLRRAVKAVGGESALSGLGQLKITAKGANRINYEHGTPDELIETGTYARTYTFDV